MSDNLDSSCMVSALKITVEMKSSHLEFCPASIVHVDFASKNIIANTTSGHTVSILSQRVANRGPRKDNPTKQTFSPRKDNPKKQTFSQKLSKNSVRVTAALRLSVRCLHASSAWTQTTSKNNTTGCPTCQETGMFCEWVLSQRQSSHSFPVPLFSNNPELRRHNETSLTQMTN